ncbi:uncharacterized protein LOC121417953 [Lytechinus variegatus]|uniref:uncharacterized protein LOC121417953 n=1 Tax=Lytechinus variegatus TaxID=7654 RepID=UPI001BB23694|nr:uncharacterized protein LOC121417953 [Lytechinus variegatus]
MDINRVYRLILVLVYFVSLFGICLARRGGGGGGYRRSRTGTSGGSSGGSSGPIETSDIIWISCSTGIPLGMLLVYLCYYCFVEKPKKKKKREESQAVVVANSQDPQTPSDDHNHGHTNPALSPDVPPGGFPTTGPGQDQDKTPFQQHPKEMAPPSYNHAIGLDGITFRGAGDIHEMYRTDQTNK